MAAYPSGLGNDQQALQATAAMRQEPWYLQWLSSHGITPSADQQVKLSKDQQDELYQLALSHGIGLNHKYDQIDENGQISEGHHKLRNTLIGAGIGAAALTGLGAAGIGPLTGLFGAGAAAAPAAAGVEGLTATSLGLPVTAGLGTAGAAAGGGAAAALTTGSRISSLFNAAGKIGNTLNRGDGMADPRGSSYAAEANQLANNRAAQARIDQGGPTSDTTALRNAMRAELLARSAPAAPRYAGSSLLPSLDVGDTGRSYANTLATNLRTRQAAGKTPTEFGIADPTQEELDAQAKAADAAGVGTGLNSRIADIGSYLQTGSRLANLGKNVFDYGKVLF